MKINILNIAIIIIVLGMASCITRTNQNQETNLNDSIYSKNEDKKLDKEYIISLVKEDQEKRHIGSWKIEESTSSPLFYEAICDDGLYLYRVTNKCEKIYVVMIEDANIGYLGDFISGRTDTTGVEYKHNGSYEIIDDTIVNVIFDIWCRNYCHTNDSDVYEPIYHMRCVHRYELNNRVWNSIKKDTAVLLDKRCDAFCGDKIWEYTH